MSAVPVSEAALTCSSRLSSMSAQRSQIAATSLDIGGMVLAGAVLIALGLGLVALWQSRLKDPILQSIGESATGETTSTAGTANTSTETEPTSGTTAAKGTDSVTAGETDSAPEPVESDAGIVIDILETNGGRMRQAEIVESTDWSKSKVSMVLSEMEDDGQISKLRVGRENIVSLRGNEPEAAGSPFDDE